MMQFCVQVAGISFITMKACIRQTHHLFSCTACALVAAVANNNDGGVLLVLEKVDKF